MCYKKNNDIFEISIKHTFRGTYCNHRLNFAVDQCNITVIKMVWKQFVVLGVCEFTHWECMKLRRYNMFEVRKTIFQRSIVSFSY